MGLMGGKVRVAVKEVRIESGKSGAHAAEQLCKV